MKTNAWIRLCLIVLSLAMVVSMFACGNGNDDTTAAPETPSTEAPAVNTTEAPAVNTTEAPAVNTTEAPVIETTEAPVIETTEAPVIETTEVPTTETTEAPTTETTEAPVTETTEAPTTETTEAPVTETTETETTEAPVEGDFLEFWDKEDIEFGVYIPSYYYVEPTEEGIILENTNGVDAPISFFSGRAEGEKATGKYFFIKYKAPAQDVLLSIFTATDSDKPVGTRTVNIKTDNGLVNDNEWHLLVVDLSKHISLTPAEDGQYYLRHLRIDIEGSYLVYLEIAYMGLTDEISDIADYVQATESVEDLQAICPHLDECISGEYVDDETHAAVCTFCGMASGVTAHTPAAKAAWNDENGRYEATCTVCGGAVPADWQWVRDFSAVADGKTYACTGGGTSHKVQNGVLVITPNKNTSWGGLSVGADGAGMLGQYYVLKYRVVEVANGATTANIAVRFNGKVTTVAMEADGAWHTAVIDLGAALGVEVVDGMFDFNGDHWLLNYVDANLVKYEVALEACVDSLDRLPEGYDADVPEREPAGDTTEEETTEAPADEPVESVPGSFVFDAEKIANTSTNGKLEVEATETGVKFTNPTGSDANFTLFSNLNGVETGNLLFFKYRANEASSFEVFTSTTSAGPVGGQSFKYSLNLDGEWHIAIIVASPLKADDNGLYFAKHLRIDVEGSEGAWAEFAYIGYANAASAIVEYVKSVEDADGLEALCPHITELAAGTWIDEYTHAEMCQLCGLTGEASAHTGASVATWNAENKRYENECTVCGGVAVQNWQWVMDYSKAAEGKTYACTGGGTSHKVQNGVLAITPNGNTSWGGLSVGVNGASKIGQYYVIKYRVLETAEAAETVNISLRFNSKANPISLKADGEWHVDVIDLAALLGLEIVDGMFEATGDHWILNFVDANLIKYEIAFEACVDSLDRLPSVLPTAE